MLLTVVYAVFEHSKIFEIKNNCIYHKNLFINKEIPLNLIKTVKVKKNSEYEENELWKVKGYDENNVKLFSLNSISKNNFDNLMKIFRKSKVKIIDKNIRK